MQTKGRCFGHLDTVRQGHQIVGAEDWKRTVAVVKLADVSKAFECRVQGEEGWVGGHCETKIHDQLQILPRRRHPRSVKGLILAGNRDVGQNGIQGILCNGSQGQIAIALVRKCWGSVLVAQEKPARCHICKVLADILIKVSEGSINSVN